ncbi:MAG: DNA-deoxyinosine glycosylase [Bdellovibrionales bacterium]
MTFCAGFPPVSQGHARVLVLGTLPGVASLKKRQYYGNGHNAFWKIMGELTGAVPGLPYEERLERMASRGVALWDVCKSAQREGSLDSAIESEQPNDFGALFEAHEHIALIAFNGQPAERLFRRLVRPQLEERIRVLPCVVLPSTSPAYASMRYAEKLARWREELGGYLGA